MDGPLWVPGVQVSQKCQGQRWHRSHHLLGTQFGKGTMKGTISTEPFIDHDPQRILVTGRARLALDLLGGHVGDGADHFLILSGERNCNPQTGFSTGWDILRRGGEKLP